MHARRSSMQLKITYKSADNYVIIVYARKYLPPHIHGPGFCPGLGPLEIKPPIPGSGDAA